MKRLLQGLFIGTALLVLSARPAAAQSVSGGYALVNWNGCCAHGFMIDYAHPIDKAGNVSAVADFGWTRFGDPDLETDTTFTGGARFKFLPESKVPVYGQVTLGVVHWSLDATDQFPKESGDDFILGFGYGAIFKATDKIGVKPQVDFFILPKADDWFFRFSINAVYNFKK